MKTRCAVLLSACCLSIVAGRSTVVAAELPGLVLPDGLGVNIHFTDPRAGEMNMLAQGGFRWIRMDFAWQSMERTKGTYDFSAWDRLMKVLEAKHIRAVFILNYSNPLYDDGMSPASDEGRAAFARWAAAAAHHFRGRGILWEMYNEPNLNRFWKPKSDVQQYIKLALEVGKAMRRAEPRELYVGPATSRIDFKFLEPCFQSGLLEYWSAVSVHPYRGRGPESAAAEYAQLREMIAKYAPKGKNIPILSGEWGYSSASKGIGVDTQGKYLPRQWLTNVSNGVRLSIWYDWHDDGEDPNEREFHFGTVYFPYLEHKTPVYRPKPAYLAAKTLTRELSGYCFRERLAIGGDDDYVLAFCKDGDPQKVRWAAWTTADSPHTVVIPVPAGKYVAVGHLGNAQPPLAAGANGLSLNLTDAPIYLKPQPRR
jgi:polysaccharide biosynthesis protein PslG